MAVQAHNKFFGVDGHAESLNAFRRAHEQNSEGLLNFTEGRPTDAHRPAYDPKHPCNQWPLAMHHPEKGEMQVGRSLKGVDDPKTLRDMEALNNEALELAVKAGYREEPYIKPQAVPLDPIAERAEFERREKETRGMLAQLLDANQKMAERLASLESSKKTSESAPPKKG